MSILVIGLGKLGYPMAEFLSSSQLNIKAYDTNKNLINKLKKGVNPIPNEKAIESYINNGNIIKYFTDLSQAFENTEICFITVPTPSLKDKSFDNKYILNTLSKTTQNDKRYRKCFMIKKNFHKSILYIKSWLIPY